MITIELPWPDKALNPNARNRWAKVKATTQARNDAYYITCAVVGPYELKGPYIYDTVRTGYKAQYTFHPPDRRRRDRDNYSAMMKAYQDGVCDALGVDDSCFEMAAPIWGEVVKGGRVVLTLEEME